MKKISYEDISIFLVKHSFHLRFWIARQTKKSKIIRKIIEKLLFEGDEIIIIPNTQKLETEKPKPQQTKTEIQTQNSTDSLSQNNLQEDRKIKNKINKTTNTVIKSEIKINQEIANSQSQFLPTEILKIAIKEASDIVIMKQCLCRISNDCEDYPQDLGCIFMGPATKKIPRKYGYEASVEEALEHVDKADAAGLSHLIGRNKIDTVWMNVGPKEELLTVCHCCPCCCLWKVFPDLDEEISNKLEKLPGVELEFIQENCKNCKKCLKDICFTDAIKWENDKIAIDLDKCKECGRCANVCKHNALKISYTKKSVYTILNRIENLVDYKKD